MDLISNDDDSDAGHVPYAQSWKYRSQMVPTAELPISPSSPAPYSVVRTLPVLRLPGRSLPFLFVEGEDGAITLQHDVLAWANASCGYRNLSSLENDVAALGRFYDFSKAFTGGVQIPEENIDYLVYAFLVWRLNGTQTGSAGELSDLCWKPLALEGLMSEFKAISRYFAFSAKAWGHISLGRNRLILKDGSAPLTRLNWMRDLKNNDFLVHLSASREFWKTLSGGDLRMPLVIRSHSRPKSTACVMPESEITAIIDAETNPIFRALWTVGAYGGIRISEQLNAWQVDIQPGSFRKLLFGYDAGDDVVFVRADPTSSRFLGDPGQNTETRRQFLTATYQGRLIPRPEYAKKHPLRAGWKGTLFLDKTLL